MSEVPQTRIAHDALCYNDKIISFPCEQVVAGRWFFPLMTKDQATVVVRAFEIMDVKGAEGRPQGVYDSARDAFVFSLYKTGPYNTSIPDDTVGHELLYEAGWHERCYNEKGLYAIGAGTWTWDNDSFPHNGDQDCTQFINAEDVPGLMPTRKSEVGRSGPAR